MWHKVEAELLQLQRLFRTDVPSDLLLSKELQAVKNFNVIYNTNVEPSALNRGILIHSHTYSFIDLDQTLSLYNISLKKMGVVLEVYWVKYHYESCICINNGFHKEYEKLNCVDSPFWMSWGLFTGKKKVCWRIITLWDRVGCKTCCYLQHFAIDVRAVKEIKGWLAKTDSHYSAV